MLEMVGLLIDRDAREGFCCLVHDTNATCLCCSCFMKISRSPFFFTLENTLICFLQSMVIVTVSDTKKRCTSVLKEGAKILHFINLLQPEFVGCTMKTSASSESQKGCVER